MNYLMKKRLALIKNKTFHGYMKTAGGCPLTLSNCMENGLINLKISGNNVGDYDSTSNKYKIPLKFNGTNLFDVSKISISSSVEIIDDKVYIKGYTTTLGIRPEKFLEITGLKPGDQITVSRKFKTITGTENGSTGSIFFVRKNSSVPDYTLIGRTNESKTSIIPDNLTYDNYYGLYFVGASADDESGQRLTEFSQIQITKGNELKDYEPYHETQSFNICTLLPASELSINFKKKTATSGTDDIASIQDWSETPKLWNGTVTVTADTETKPSDMEVQYYSSEEE